MIHPTAIIHPNARLDPTVEVGPYAVIHEHVTLGANCVVGPHVTITGMTAIGVGNRFHAGCVIGDAPQDLKYRDAPSRLRIGDHNVFREHVTAHRATGADEETVIGSHNFLMANVHVGHNCVVGDYVIMANGALLGGHVIVQDRAFISGNCLVHQFTRVGTLAMMQGGAAVSKDVPPFSIASGRNTVSGLNVVGLRRAGFNSQQRLELRQVYHRLFRGGGLLRTALEEARREFTSGPALTLVEFVANARRGVCSDAGRSRGGQGDAEGVD